MLSWLEPFKAAFEILFTLVVGIRGVILYFWGSESKLEKQKYYNLSTDDKIKSIKAQLEEINAEGSRRDSKISTKIIEIEMRLNKIDICIAELDKDVEYLKERRKGNAHY